MPFPSGSPAQQVQTFVGGTLGALQAESVSLAAQVASLNNAISHYGVYVVADGVTTWAQKMPRTMAALIAARDACQVSLAAVNASLPELVTINALMAESSGLLP